METEQKRKIGKDSKKKGREFEKKVRLDLEKEGFIVCKWNNNVDFFEDGKVITGKIVQTKPRFNPFTKSLMMNSGGFPDFLCWLPFAKDGYKLIGVEAKSGRGLDKEEKSKIKWYIEHGVFSKILIASPDNKMIKYEDVLWK